MVQLAERPLSLEEWGGLPDDLPGELVKGRLEEEEVPTALHEVAVAWFLFSFYSWVRPRGGWAFGSDGKIAIAEGQGRKPDVSVYFPGAPHPAASDAVWRPPSLVVEVLSPGPQNEHRDRVAKRADYARAGIGAYWLVDPVARQVEVFRRAGNGYALAAAATRGTQPVAGCDGLSIDLDDLWRTLDEALGAD